MRRGIFPKELKISRINPIYKSGKKDYMNNYRPISIVDEYQYGFVKNSSTLSATVDLVNHISRALDNKQIVVVVFVDLKKMFDVVSFDILLD